LVRHRPWGDCSPKKGGERENGGETGWAISPKYYNCWGRVREREEVKRGKTLTTILGKGGGCSVEWGARLNNEMGVGWKTEGVGESHTENRKRREEIKKKGTEVIAQEGNFGLTEKRCKWKDDAVYSGRGKVTRQEGGRGVKDNWRRNQKSWEKIPN